MLRCLPRRQNGVPLTQDRLPLTPTLSPSGQCGCTVMDRRGEGANCTAARSTATEKNSLSPLSKVIHGEIFLRGEGGGEGRTLPRLASAECWCILAGNNTRQGYGCRKAITLKLAGSFFGAR